MATSQEEISQDDIFDLLSNPRRRFVINYLLREDRPVGIQELSRELATWEFEVEPEELTDQQEKRIYVALYQTHVPKLEEAGVVDYDADASLIELTDAATQLQPYVDDAPARDRPWPWYYLAVTAVGAVLFAGAQFAAGPLAALSPFQVGVVTAGALVALAMYHYYETLSSSGT